MVPTKAAAEAKAGGDSSHNFQDQGWYNHERSKSSASQTLHESEVEPGEFVWLYVVRGVTPHCRLRYIRKTRPTHQQLQPHEAGGDSAQTAKEKAITSKLIARHKAAPKVPTAGAKKVGLKPKPQYSTAWYLIQPLLIGKYAKLPCPSPLPCSFDTSTAKKRVS